MTTLKEQFEEMKNPKTFICTIGALAFITWLLFYSGVVSVKAYMPQPINDISFNVTFTDLGSVIAVLTIAIISASIITFFIIRTVKASLNG